MKVCFLFQRRFVLIGHALSRNLHALDATMQFCALVSRRESLEFLQHQKEIQYTALLLEEDIHKKLWEEEVDVSYLQALEKEYGIPNLWPYLYIDRVVMSGQLVREYPHDTSTLSHREMLQRLQVTAKEIISFLDREKPDAVIMSVVGSVGSTLLYYIAKKRGIRTITIDLSRIENGVAFSDDYRTFTETRRLFKEVQNGRASLQKEAARDFIARFRENPAPYHQQASITFNDQTLRRANVRFLRPSNFLKSATWHLKTFFHDLRQKRDGDYTDIYIWWAVWDKARRKIRGLIGYSDLYTSPPAPGEKYAYFPLHYEPEISLLLYAPFYTDQLSVIRATARSLPINMILYVKEHPAMVGYRTRSFYKSLIKTPNVRLVPPSTSGQYMVKEAALTITITGTAGWESVILQKPVITFGDVFYNDIPGVKRCRGFEELPYLVKEQLETWRHDEKALVDYVSALIEDSVPVDYIDLWQNAQSVEEIRTNAGIKTLAEHLFRTLTKQSHSL